MQSFLLVDDDEVFHLLGIRALQRVGFANNQIQTALNGREAMELIHTQGMDKLPDIIFLDLNMPIMNGFEFMEIFKTLRLEKQSNAKIIVLSSSNNPADIERAMKLGASQYLTKPLTEEMLSTVLTVEKVAS